MRGTVLAGALAVAVSALAAPSLAETEGEGHGMDHSGHAMHGDESPATRAFMEANMRMHAGMEIDYSGDADVDFMRGMIAHHQGAIDMARIVLEHGDDPEARKLAEEIIAAQEAEIAFMQGWLEKNAK
jgi:uncharacterized protein (DUF305 family)